MSLKVSKVRLKSMNEFKMPKHMPLKFLTKAETEKHMPLICEMEQHCYKNKRFEKQDNDVHLIDALRYAPWAYKGILEYRVIGEKELRKIYLRLENLVLSMIRHRINFKKIKITPSYHLKVKNKSSYWLDSKHATLNFQCHDNYYYYDSDINDYVFKYFDLSLFKLVCNAGNIFPVSIEKEFLKMLKEEPKNTQKDYLVYANNAHELTKIISDSCEMINREFSLKVDEYLIQKEKDIGELLRREYGTKNE